MLDGLSVDSGDVSATGVPRIGEALDIGGESAMRKASITVGGLRSVAKAARGTGPSLRTRHVLHPEKMRGDKTVPSNVG